MSSATDPATLVAPREGYARWAATYNDGVNPVLALQQRILSAVLPNAAGKVVLDLGCGTGRVMDLWRERHPARLLGVDLSSEMLRHSSGAPASFIVGDCCSLPIASGVADIVSCCLTVGYLPDLQAFAREVARVLNPSGLLILAELHPETAQRFGWNRGFSDDYHSVTIQCRAIPIPEVLAAFAAVGFTAEMLLQPEFESSEQELFAAAGKLEYFHRYQGSPALYVARLRYRDPAESTTPATSLTLNPSRIALSGSVALPARVETAGDRLAFIGPSAAESDAIDLSGYMLLPGLINAHDHLEFALFPRLGRGNYANSREWAEAIYRPNESPVREHLQVPKQVRLWWGAIRNLLAGVTTVCHHNPYDESVFNNDFPVRVVRDFSWAHSLHFDHDIVARHLENTSVRPFIIHLAEGSDELSAAEIFEADRLGVLDERTVIVHGNALSADGLELLRERAAGLVWCPSSNHFLFGRTLTGEQLTSLSRRALGSDSPLTAAGDLLDEVRFAHQLGAHPEFLYELVTSGASDILRLKRGEGRLNPAAVADFVAVGDQGLSPSEAISALSFREVDLVITGGRIRLASDELMSRLPKHLTSNLELLVVDGVRRWIAAPVGELLAQSRQALGPTITMCGRTLTQ